MANIKKIQKEMKNVVSKLSSDKLAEIYFQDRKRFIKMGMNGEKNKAIDLLKKNDDFYKINIKKMRIYSTNPITNI